MSRGVGSSESTCEVTIGRLSGLVDPTRSDSWSLRGAGGLANILDGGAASIWHSERRGQGSLYRVEWLPPLISAPYEPLNAWHIGRVLPHVGEGPTLEYCSTGLLNPTAAQERYLCYKNTVLLL